MEPKRLVDMENVWPKKITVDKRIVGLLSVSTYNSFPRALKELITNSYDADAKNVEININLDEELVTVFDDGKGMTEEDFAFYIRIAGKTRQKEANTTKLGRKIIGQFGVGFLAVFPFFKSYKIESKKAGSSKILYANIPLHKYFVDSNKPIDIGNILINGGQRTTSENIGESFTKITLTGFNELTKSFLNNSDTKFNSRSIDTYEGVERLRWILSDDLPLKFREDSFNNLFDYPEVENFKVKINSIPLYREVYGSEILETNTGEYLEVGRIKCKFFISTPGRAVSPYHARYLKIRNLNVGVGENREHFGVAHGATRSRLHWLTGEVHIIEGMNDLINISRDGFSFNNDYEELKKILNQKLNYHSNRLEKEADLTKELKQAGEGFRIQDVKLLDPKVITKKIQDLKNEGIDVHRSLTKAQPNNDSSGDLFYQSFNGDFPMKFEKRIVVGNAEYVVSVDSWRYRDELYKACKINNGKIIINSEYPLFQGRKFTDIFIKMHLMITFQFDSGQIDVSVFNRLNKDILKFFKEYS